MQEECANLNSIMPSESISKFSFDNNKGKIISNFK